MDKNLQNIENLFREGLDDNEEMPSSNVWDGIDNRLDKDNVISIKKKYSNLKRVALLLLLLLIGFSLYELNYRRTNSGFAEKNNNAGNKETVTGNNNNESQKSVNKNISASKNINNNTTLNPIPDNNSQVPPGNNLITDKQYQKSVSPIGNDIANTPTILKQRYLFVNPSENRQKIKPSEPGEDKQTTLVNNNTVQINNSLLFPWQLNLLPVEKINTPTILSPDSKNSLYAFALTKSNPLIDIKNSVTQQAKKKETKPSRFSITGFFSPDIASYHLEEDQPGNQPETARKIEKGERHEFSSTFGLLLDYNLNKHWSLQSGLTFSNTNIKVNPKTIYAQNDNNGNIKYRVNISSGYGYILPSFQNAPSIGDSLKVTTATHKLRYIGIPVAVKYKFGKEKSKLSFVAMAGVTTNFLTKGKLETEVQKGPDDEVEVLNNIQGLKSVYFSGMAGAGAEYKLTRKLSVSLMPTARFALNPINKGAVVKTYPNSFGLSASARISL